MPLDVTPMNRNLATRVTFMSLEFEDLFLVLTLAAVMNVVGHFVNGDIGGIPLSMVLEYGVPLSAVPLLMIFKYGRPRAYCALAHDRQITSGYFKEMEEETRL